MKKNLIKLDKISFGYNDDKFIIKDLSLNINKYSIFGLLGHNGAGKTTLFKILLGLIEPQLGNIKFNEDLLYENLELNVAYMPENNGLYENLTIYQNIIFRGLANHLTKKDIINRSKELINEFSLNDKKNERVSKLSNGMKKKVALIATLIINPKVILLDEPTNGIDPESLRDIISIIKKLRDQKCIVIISSHDLNFIEQVVDHVYILEHGELAYSGEYFKDINSSLLNTYIDKLQKYREGEKNHEKFNE
ncbi:ABC transporter ATP-binding protein [Clostridium saccharobutylicum]|uniref:Lipopolysaccharide export system ATP-binding protein LptB n=1 Tax=Clostridium saccharobutylicum TaxID=169679 RepID=A0A1S8N673_CLOSA|nr:ABC transporter ATP-binding protein [Clostridium saccharobutylicum]OOM11964.1 lipopolysaccharide export system ATP-binding protein LptB [Clostridium saccharobutylicum]